MGRIWLVVSLLTAASARGDEIDEEMMRAQMVMEPEHILRDVIEKLDARLDADPKDGKSWRTLARALDMGVGLSSKHAANAKEARRKAWELSPDDCHLAALFARGDAATAEKWRGREPSCAEMVYVQAGGTDASLLEKSIALKPGAEAYVALGVLQLRDKKWADARRSYKAALQAAPLFPEDWRMDGWIAVHARLGLALAAAGKGDSREQAAQLRKMHAYYDDPGPWHDLSDEEKALAKKLLKQTF